MTPVDWTTKRYFKRYEFLCSYCGTEKMEESFVSLLDELRAALGFPMIVSSGYRCPEHPLEVVKVEPGTHTTGIASDIRVYGERAYNLVRLAIGMGFRGLGVDQFVRTPYANRFIHLDTFAGDDVHPRPRTWSYR
jgi:zinc D-Ala-D-Ala carboxypeptidase